MSIKIEKLTVSVWEKEILKGINIEFIKWKNYLILWKNWSGKSTLVNYLMWNPIYTKIDWNIDIDNENLLNMSPDQRSKKGIFLSFQNIPEIEGVNLWEFLRIIYNLHLKNKNLTNNDISPFIFKRLIKKYLEELNISDDFLNRDLNVWFSWWEKRKIEILQMKLIEPDYIFLDEFDSWLDVNAFRDVSLLLKGVNNDNNSIIVITHHFDIMDFLPFDEVIVIENWSIINRWGLDLVEKIKKEGF